MRRLYVAICLIFAAALLPAAAAAQVHRFELTPVVGYRLDGDFDASRDDFFDDFDLTVDSSASYGLLFDIPLSPNWQIELLANRQQSELVVEEELFGPEETLGDVDITVLQAGIVLQWGRGQVNPFVTGALGMTRIEPQIDGVSAEDRLSASFGGGVKIFFAENVGLRLEGRGYWTDLDTDSDDRCIRCYDSEAGLYQSEASAGLIIAF